MGFFNKVKANTKKQQEFAHKLYSGEFSKNKLPSMKTGGVAKTTCPHILHKGEMVIPKTLVKHFNKILTK